MSALLEDKEKKDASEFKMESGFDCGRNRDFPDYDCAQLDVGLSEQSVSDARLVEEGENSSHSGGSPGFRPSGWNASGGKREYKRSSAQ